MHASNQTGRARFVRRLAQAIGVMAIASGVAVTGAATTHAGGPTTNMLTLHNNSASNYQTSEGGTCDGFQLPNPSMSYWHFIVSTSTYSFTSITLDLLPAPAGNPVTYTSASPNVSIVGKQAYIPVPAGDTLASLQLDSTAVITPGAPVGKLPNFNLSHTCSGLPTDVCANEEGIQTAPEEGSFINDSGDCVPDVCLNLKGGQETAPPGYTDDGEGTCTPNEGCGSLQRNPESAPAIVIDDNNCPPTDVCPNIGDVQETVPPGMFINGAGNCVPDVCPNIDDNQETVPSGMFINGAGNCVPDVCTNIANNQETVPSGFFLNASGNCVPDVCTNIPDNQETVPGGMFINPAGNCVPDVCTNIPDGQEKIPAQLITDGKGGCVSPPVEQSSPPPAVDLCSNIDGAQATVPVGFTATGTMCTATESASEAVTPQPITLPVTGSNTASGIAIGLGMVGAGLILSALARRRSARSA